MTNINPYRKNERGPWDDVFDIFDKNIFHSNTPSIRTDIIDQGQEFVLQAELPGLDKKDIKVAIQNNNLHISANYTETHEEQGDNNFIRRERKFGSFYRSFDISGINQEKIHAEYNNGILELHLPKLDETKKSHQREININ